jgi:nitric oxide synthase-interacting protein
LAQKKEIKRLDKAREKADKEEQQEQARQDEEAHDRAVKDFEKTQAGLDEPSTRKNDPIARDRGLGVPKTGSKRKFVMDESDVARVSENDKRRARNAIDEEKVAGSV